MPELPEVETIVRKLQTVLPGKKIHTTVAVHAKTFVGDPAVVIGLEVLSVTRRAKIIQLQLSQGQNLLIHLKMTGQLIYLDHEQRLGGGHPTPDWINELPSKHTRVFFAFKDTSQLFFNDQRLFGWIKLLADHEVKALFSALAPDVIDEVVTAEYLANKIKNRSQNIKQLSMDNTVMCGLGNIYACDALNMAKLHPLRPGKSLSFAEIETLLHSAKEILAKGIELGGTTFDGKYVDSEGLAGKYQNIVRVYDREGLPCQNCQQLITKMQIGGRGTYFCANCQL